MAESFDKIANYEKCFASLRKYIADAMSYYYVIKDKTGDKTYD